jgi:hypothetical protein
MNSNPGNAPQQLTGRQGMACEKCNAGTMFQTKVHRLSGCLVAIGFCLLIPAIGAVLLAGVTMLASIFGGNIAGQSILPLAQSNAVHELSAIKDMPASFVEFFKTNQLNARSHIPDLPPEIQPSATEALDKFEIKRVEVSNFGRGMALGGGVFSVVVFVAALPLLIVGFLLVLKKKVWRCKGCGFIFDRA